MTELESAAEDVVVRYDNNIDLEPAIQKLSDLLPFPNENWMNFCVTLKSKRCVGARFSDPIKAISEVHAMQIMQDRIDAAKARDLLEIVSAIEIDDEGNPA